jgi:hypothetical protein
LSQRPAEQLGESFEIGEEGEVERRGEDEGAFLVDLAEEIQQFEDNGQVAELFWNGADLRHCLAGYFLCHLQGIMLLLGAETPIDLDGPGGVKVEHHLPEALPGVSFGQSAYDSQSSIVDDRIQPQIKGALTRDAAEYEIDVLEIGQPHAGVEKDLSVDFVSEGFQFGRGEVVVEAGEDVAEVRVVVGGVVHHAQHCCSLVDDAFGQRGALVQLGLEQKGNGGVVECQQKVSNRHLVLFSSLGQACLEAGVNDFSGSRHFLHQTVGPSEQVTAWELAVAVSAARGQLYAFKFSVDEDVPAEVDLG